VPPRSQRSTLVADPIARRSQQLQNVALKKIAAWLSCRWQPMVSIARKHAADMVRYAGEFGLTALARTRISTGPNAPQPPGKFDGLLR
jgi:phage terminase small subunit